MLPCLALPSLAMPRTAELVKIVMVVGDHRPVASPSLARQCIAPQRPARPGTAIPLKSFSSENLARFRSRAPPFALTGTALHRLAAPGNATHR